MYAVSDEYKSAIGSTERAFRARITVGGKVYEQDVISNIVYNSALTLSEDFEIGTAIMATVKIELLDTNYLITESFEDKEAKVEVAVKLPSSAYEYVPLGLFNLESSVRNDKKLNLSGGDRMHKFEKDYISTLVYPATLLQIAQDVCSVAGVELLNTSFVNSAYTLSTQPVLDKVTCRKAIAQIAELAGGYAKITREGKLEIFNTAVSLKNVVYYASADGFITEAFDLIADEIITGIIEVNRSNYVNLSNKDLLLASIDKVIVRVGAEEAVSGTGANTYYIVDNIFCQNPVTVIAALYTALSELSYMPFTAKWRGNPALDCGDMITINTGAGYYNTLATSRKFTFSGGITEEYTSVGKSNAEKNSTGKGSLTLDMEKAKVQIKILDGKIEQTVTQYEFESYQVQTAEEIASKVSDETYQSEKIQTAELIAQKVSSGEGFSTEFNQNSEAFEFILGNGTVVSITKDKIKISHTNGDYSEFRADGLKRHIGSLEKDYHYLNYVGSAVGSGTVAPVTVQLSSEFIGKEFTVGLAPKDMLHNGYALTDWMADIKLYISGYDYPNGSFNVVAFWIASNGNQIDDKPMEFTYIVNA